METTKDAKGPGGNEAGQVGVFSNRRTVGTQNPSPAAYGQSAPGIFSGRALQCRPGWPCFRNGGGERPTQRC